MCKVLLEQNLLPLREFPKSMTIHSREYVQKTRPEDLEEYSYIASLTENSIVDFNKFRVVSSDLSWDGINYLLPIAQRYYLNSRDEAVIDFFEGFIWLLGYKNGMQCLLNFMSLYDIFLLRNWFCILLDNKENEPDYVDYYKNEIRKYISLLGKYLCLS